MIKFMLTFGAGVYTGMYISQNYEVPRVDEPAKIMDKLKEFADDHRKNFGNAQVMTNEKLDKKSKITTIDDKKNKDKTDKKRNKPEN